jgi:uncharacterized protein YndB with AHSA1/START domain
MTAVVHNSFTIERTYPSPPARVFSAFADRDLKSRWFGGPEIEHELDFRVGGHERLRNRGGGQAFFESRYHAIVRERRIVFSYDLHLDGAHVSTSLTTVELEPDGAGTRLTFTEQGAFFDGLDDPAGREHGTGGLLDALGEALA